MPQKEDLEQKGPCLVLWVWSHTMLSKGAACFRCFVSYLLSSKPSGICWRLVGINFSILGNNCNEFDIWIRKNVSSWRFGRIWKGWMKYDENYCFQRKNHNFHRKKGQGNNQIGINMIAMSKTYFKMIWASSFW